MGERGSESAVRDIEVEQRSPTTIANVHVIMMMFGIFVSVCGVFVAFVQHNRP